MTSVVFMMLSVALGLAMTWFLDPWRGIASGLVCAGVSLTSRWIYDQFTHDPDHGPDPVMLGILLVASVIITLVTGILLGGLHAALAQEGTTFKGWFAWHAWLYVAAAAGSILAYVENRIAYVSEPSGA